MLNKLSSANMVESREPDSAVGVQPAKGFELQETISFVWRQWKFITSITVIALIIGAIVILKQTPYYTATALVLLEPQQKEVVPGADQTSSSVNETMVENQVSIILSTALLKHVVERTHLVGDPEFGTKAPQRTDDSGAPPDESAPAKLIATVGALLGTKAPQRTDDSGAPPDESTPAKLIATVGALQGALTVRRRGLGTIFSISITSVDPNRAARLANAVANGYVVEKLDARFDAAKNASKWLSDRLVELRKQLRNSEEAVADFRVQHDLVESGGHVTLNQQQLSNLNTKLVEARNDLAQKKARLDLLRSIKEKGGDIQSLPDLPKSATLTTLRQQDANAAQKEADLLARYSSSHPRVINIRAERRDLKRAIAKATQNLVTNVQNEYELAKTRVDALEGSLQNATGQTGAEDKTSIRLRELERTAAVNKTLFENFLQKAKITQEQSSFDAEDARVITPAEPPDVPSHPRKARELAMALFIGLLLGVGGALAKEKLMNGFVRRGKSKKCLGCRFWLLSIGWKKANWLLMAKLSSCHCFRRLCRCRALVNPCACCEAAS